MAARTVSNPSRGLSMEALLELQRQNKLHTIEPVQKSETKKKPARRSRVADLADQSCLKEPAKKPRAAAKPRPKKKPKAQDKDQDSTKKRASKVSKAQACDPKQSRRKEPSTKPVSTNYVGRSASIANQTAKLVKRHQIMVDSEAEGEDLKREERSTDGSDTEGSLKDFFDSASEVEDNVHSTEESECSVGTSSSSSESEDSDYDSEASDEEDDDDMSDESENSDGW